MVWLGRAACAPWSENASFLRHFIAKMIIVPTQARDKQRKKFKRERRFLIVLGLDLTMRIGGGLGWAWATLTRQDGAVAAGNVYAILFPLPSSRRDGSFRVRQVNRCLLPSLLPVAACRDCWLLQRRHGCDASMDRHLARGARPRGIPH